MTFKKLLPVFNTTALVTLTTLVASTSAYAATPTTLVVAANPTPHAEILNFVKPYLKEHDNIDLQVKVFTDYVLPNTVVVEGQADCNFFQHIPYLTAFNKQHGTQFIPGFKVHVEPLSIYSSKYKSLKEVKKGALVALPSDPANLGRALVLLSQNNLIKLKDPKNIFSTSRDIVSNPLRLKFKEIESATLPRVLQDVDLDIINVNYALKANLSIKNALAVEDAEDSYYANLISYLPAKANDPRIKALEKALARPEVYNFIVDHFKGEIVPAFKPSK